MARKPLLSWHPNFIMENRPIGLDVYNKIPLLISEAMAENIYPTIRPKPRDMQVWQITMHGESVSRSKMSAWCHAFCYSA